MPNRPTPYFHRPHTPTLSGSGRRASVHSALGARNSALGTRHSPLRSAFTLTEMLVVISLIVLLIALAVPAFSFITGARSVEGAQNVVSAMLARARSEAVSRQSAFGVAFYRDPVNERSAMLLLVGPGDTGANDYNGWRAGVDYKVGDIVYFRASSTREANLGNNPIATPYTLPATPTFTAQSVAEKYVVVKYRCITNHTSSAAVTPPDPDSNAAPPAAFAFRQNGNWIEESAVELAPFASDVEYLPVGVGLQLVNDARGFAATNDEYVRTGIIMFGPDGQLMSSAYQIVGTSALGSTLIGLTAVQNIPAFVDGTNPAFFTSPGLVLYDLENFSNAPGDDADIRYAVGVGATPAIPATEKIEETWLSNNARLLLVNRYNGTLVRAE